MNTFDEQYRLDVAEAIKRAEAADLERRKKQALLDAAPRMLGALEAVVEVLYTDMSYSSGNDAGITRLGGERINLSALIREARGET